MQKYAGNASDPNGRAIDAASVLVTTSTGAVAQLYSDNGITTRANPVVTGPDGEYAFYAANGRYSLAISAAGYATDFLSDILLHDPVGSEFKSQVVPWSASPAWDAGNGTTMKITIAGNTVIPKPANLKNGPVIVEATMTTGSWTIGFAADYKLNPVVIETGDGAINVFAFHAVDGILYGISHTRIAGIGTPPATPAPPAPAPAPAPSAGAIADLFSSGQDGAWFASSDALSIIRGDGTAGVLGGTFSRWSDKSGRGRHLVELVSGTYPNYNHTAGVTWAGYYDPVEVSAGGGSTGGFFLGIALEPTAWMGNARTLWTDVPSASPNLGHKIRINADNQFEFSVGLGSSRATVTATDKIIDGAAGATKQGVVLCRDTGTAISVKVRDGTVFTTSYGSGAQAGGVAWRLGHNLDEAVSGPIWDGKIFAMVYRRSSGLTQTEVDAVATYLNAEMTVASISDEAAQTPEALPASFVANPNTGLGFAFGAKVDGEYPYGIKPAAVAADQTAVNTVLKNHYTAWKAVAVVDVPGITGGKAIKFGTNPTFLTVSEGAGYGMLLAVLFAGHDAGAQTLFDGLLTTVRARPAYSVTAQNALGAYLMEWRLNTNGTSGGDGWNAMDGDLDIAMALMMADRQWGSAGTWNYAQQAANTIAAIKWWNMKTSGTTKGLATPNVSRTSDYMFGHFRAFKAHKNDPFWETAAVTTEGKGNAVARAKWLIDRMQTVYSPNVGLMPDFIVNTHTSTPNPSPGMLGDGNFDEDKYWWNACRNPWRFASDYMWSGDADLLVIINKMNAFFKAEVDAAAGDITAIGTGYKLDGTQVTGGDSPAFHGPILAGACVSATYQTFANALWTWNAGHLTTGYYDGEIQLLSMVVASGNWWTPRG